MTNDYTYDGIPDDNYLGAALPSVTAAVLEKFPELLKSEHLISSGVTFGHLYERKGYYSFIDPAVTPDSKFFHEDLIVTVNLRLDVRGAQEIAALAVKEGVELRDAELEKKKAELDEAIEKLQRERDSLN